MLYLAEHKLLKNWVCVHVIVYLYMLKHIKYKWRRRG